LEYILSEVISEFVEGTYFFDRPWDWSRAHGGRLVRAWLVVIDRKLSAEYSAETNIRQVLPKTKKSLV
jgi:hypothetical protein